MSFPSPDVSRARFAAPLPLFAAASLLAVVAGAWTMRLAGEPVILWARNPAAWLAAALCALPLRRWQPGAVARRTMLGLALLALGATLLSPGQQSVHRWLRVGPLMLNGAAFVLPSLIVLLTREPHRLGRAAVAAVAASVLALQPDTSQAVAFALACLCLAVREPAASLPRRLVLVGPAALAAAIAALRPDPLAPVPEVEGIVILAAEHSVVIALLLLLGLAGAVLAPLRAPQALPLALYLATVAIFPALGAFPVPLAGYGVSFILGQFLGIALLLPAESRPALAT